ncbi:MAG: autotransporter domain-containing protein [Prosthecobacter sp.]|uniref:autotransporter outer membrane beta-barrel domain-containing protein n=1 Tax=Prosthecobacter sp. TaxID=1965333 RepID=UPI0025F26D79|nr:autotransporter outer membrane beta-barrel domain-containing protein [Prosthecobacter sp.]MCF7786405.1 autotransporter domain-containing protein [Prosthecobacter sp.]
MIKLTSGKNKSLNKASGGGLFAVALLALGSLGQEVKAGELWDGGSLLPPNGNWSDVTNWAPDGLPVFGLGIQFGGSTQLTATNDLLAIVIGGTGITFNGGAGAFTLDGNAITLSGGITNNSTNVQTISFGTTGITLGAGQTWNAATGGLNVTSAVDLAGQALVVDGTNNTNISGAITDTVLGGSLAKNGTGTLTTSSLLNTYAGTTTVNTGTLNVLGNHIGGDTYTIAAGATLAGTGVITEAPGVSINNNGAIVVGDANALIPVASTFTVNTSGAGAINMGLGSTLAVDLFTGAGLGNNTLVLGSSDTFILGGNLNSVAGGTLVIGNPTALTGFTGGDSWQVVTLLPGATITGNLGLTGNLNTTALNLTATQVGNFSQTSGVFTVIDTITGLQMGNAMGQAVLASTQSVLTDVNGRLFFLRAGQGDLSDENEYNEGVVSGQGDGYGKNPPPGPVAQRRTPTNQWEVFASVNYNNAKLGAFGNQAGVQSDSWSPGVGAEIHVTPNVAIGFALNWLDSKQTFANGVGNMDMNGYALSAYTSYVKKAFWADLLYSFGSYDLETNRNTIGFGNARGDTDAYTHSVQFNSGWNFRFQNNSLVTGPFIGLDYTHVSIDGFAESSGGLAALAYNKNTTESLISRIGWSVSKYVKTDFAVITAQARLSYERQNLNNNNGTTVGLINQPFVVSAGGQNYGQDYMVAGAGLNFQFTPAFGLLLNYQGQFFRQSVEAHYVGLRLSYKF